MGGRGINSGADTQQTTIDRLFLIQEISRIQNHAEFLRSNMEDVATGVGGGDLFPKKKKCACCEVYAIPIGTEYEICLVCGWIDDPYQNSHPDSLEGRNSMSLKDAKQVYKNRL